MSNSMNVAAAVEPVDNGQVDAVLTLRVRYDCGELSADHVCQLAKRNLSGLVSHAVSNGQLSFCDDLEVDEWDDEVEAQAHVDVALPDYLWLACSEGEWRAIQDKGGLLLSQFRRSITLYGRNSDVLQNAVDLLDPADSPDTYLQVPTDRLDVSKLRFSSEGVRDLEWGVVRKLATGPQTWKASFAETGTVEYAADIPLDCIRALTVSDFWGGGWHA